MADGWRNRFMAPVYALVISFGFVVILGAALNDPTRISFVIAGQSGLPEAFQGFQVRVETVAGKRPLADEHVGRSGEFTLPTPDEEIRICTTLPEGWSTKDATLDVASRVSCSDRRLARGEDVVITLDRQG